jgi:hypothetical protein
MIEQVTGRSGEKRTIVFGVDADLSIMADKLRSCLREREERQAANLARAAANGIEPPG